MTIGLSLSAIIAIFMAGLWLKNAIAEMREIGALKDENKRLKDEAQELANIPATDDDFDRIMRERIKRKD